MPSVAKIVGSILLLATAAPLAAQQYPPAGATHHQPEIPAADPAGFSSSAQSAEGRGIPAASDRTVPYSQRKDGVGPQTGARLPRVGGIAAEQARGSAQPPLILPQNSNVVRLSDARPDWQKESSAQGGAVRPNANTPAPFSPGNPAGRSGRATGWPPGSALPAVVQATYESPLASRGRAADEPPAPAQPASSAIALPPLSRESPAAMPAPGGARAAEAGTRAGLPSTVTVLGSLGIVLGIFLLFAFVLRRAAPRGSTVLPGEVVEVLGRAPLAGRQQLHLLRCGNKLLLVSVTPSGAKTLTEITDPLEVDRLAGLCLQARPNSATAAFRQVFQHFNQQHSSPEFAGQKEHDFDDYRLANAGIGGGRDAMEDRNG